MSAILQSAYLTTAVQDFYTKYYPLPFEDAYMIGVSMITWTLLYLIALCLPLPLKPKHIELNKADDLDVRNRMISFLHGFTLLIFSGYMFYFFPG